MRTPRDRIDRDFLLRTMEEVPSGSSCGCRREVQRKRNCCTSAYGVEGHPLAMVYAARQEFRNLYDCAQGLERGTIFAELDLPFYKTPCNNRKEGCRRV